MSKTVDQRIVEMRFDNKQFESGVSQTMSSIDKLNKKLNLSGASKGLNEVNSAAKNVNMSGLGSAVDSVKVKFSALQVMGVTALANITNSAVNAGKRMISALTIDPVKTGFQEYETQINAVQTILANTRSKGSTIDDVNAALAELNTYADKTIYNFTEMTRNIGTFTAAGIDLETSTNAIQGIANLAAVSGSTSQQASTAMYQLSQALAAGSVKLQDWNSVVNAGMGGEMFQNALKETSRLLGTGVDQAIEATGSYRESLRKGWLTSEVLTETLKKFTTTGANEYVAEYTGLSVEAVEAALESAEAQYGEAEAIDKASEALAKKSGKNKEEIKSALEFAKNAEDAATKVKTFSQLWDVMKEAAQSGWSKTWQLIIGDFEQAKALLTPLADFFTGIIGKMSDARNRLLESALGKTFTGLGEKIEKVLGPMKKAADVVGKVNGAVKDLGNIVDDVILGKFGNGKERFDKLTESGYNWYRVQNKVNEKLGNTKRYTKEQIEAQDKLLGTQKKNVEVSKEEAGASKEKAEATVELTKEQKKQLIELGKLTDEQLIAKGYTKEQIEALHELKNMAEKLGMPFDEFINKLDEINGRWILFDSIKNIGKAIVKPLKAIAEAFREVFKPMSGDALFNIITGFHKLTSKLVMSDEAAENLKTVFKGLFSIIKLIGTFIGGAFKAAFTFITSLFGGLDGNILEVAASVGTALSNFAKWATETVNLKEKINDFISKIPAAVQRIKSFFASLREIPAVDKLCDAVERLFSTLKKIFSFDKDGPSFKELLPELGSNILDVFKALPGAMFGIGKNIIEGLRNGLEGTFAGKIFSKMAEIGKKIISTIKDILGIHSPSTVMHEIGGNIISGLGNGIKENSGSVLDILKGFGSKIVEVFKNIDWRKIYEIAVGAGMLYLGKQIADGIGGIADALHGFADLCDGAEAVMKGFGKTLSGLGFELRAKGILKLAISLGILTLALIALSFIDTKKLWSSVAVLGSLAGILIGLSFAIDKMSQASVKLGKGGFAIDGLKSGLIAIGVALLLLAVTVRMIGRLDPEQAKQGFLGIAGLVGVIVAVLFAFGKMVNSAQAINIDKLGKMLTKLAFSMLLMAWLCKIVGKLKPEEMIKGAIFVGAFILFVSALMKVTADKYGMNVDKVGKLVMKITGAMILMIIVCKLAGRLKVGEMLKGALFAGAFVLFVKGIVKVTTVGKEHEIAKVSGLLMSMALAMLLMASVCRLIAKLSIGAMIKGALFVYGFVELVKVLVQTLTVGDKQKIESVATTILALGIAIGILAGVCLILGNMKIGHLAKGIIAVGLLCKMMEMLVKGLKGAQNVKGAIMWMAISIGIMAASIAGLSFIEPGKLAGATAAIGIVMGMFALIEREAKSVEGVSKTLIPMVIAVGALAGIIILMSKFAPDSALSNALALSTLLIAVSACMSLLDKMNVSIKDAAKGALALTAMAIPMLAFVGILFLMSKVENATKNALALTVLMTAMSLLMIPLTIIGVFWAAALAGILALTALAIPMLAFIGVMALANKVDMASANVVLLMNFMTIMVNLLVMIAKVGPMALIGVTALTGLSLLMGAIGVVATAVGALMEKFPKLQDFLNTGLPVLEQLAGSIGTMIGKFIGNLGSALGDALVKIGHDIAVFMGSLVAASASAKLIDPNSFEGVKALMKVLAGVGLESVGSAIGDVFTKIFSGKTTMEKFESDGVAFFKALKAIAKEMTGFALPEGFNAEAVQQLVTAIGSVGKQSVGTAIGDAFTKLFSGDKGANSMSKFEEDGKAFFKALKGIASEMTGFSLPKDFNPKTVEGLLEILGTVAGSSTKTSFLDMFTNLFSGGEESGGIEKFESDGVAFFKALKAIAKEMTGFKLPEDFDPETVKGLLDVISSVTGTSTKTSFLDKFIQIFSKDDENGGVAKFKEDGVAFFEALKAISDEMIGFSLPKDFDPEAVIGLLKVMEAITGSETKTSFVDKFVQLFSGDDGGSMSQFKEDGVAFFQALKAIAAEASGITDVSESTALAEGLVNKMKDIIAATKGIDYSGVAEFTGVGTGMAGADGPMHKVALAIKDFGDTVAGIDTEAINVSVSAADKLKTLINQLVGLDTSGIANFKIEDIGNAMKTYGELVNGIDPEKVLSSVTSANRLRSFIIGLVGLDTSGISNFKVKAIGDALNGYSSSLTSFDAGVVIASVAAANRLRLFIGSLAGLDGSGAGTFKDAVDQLSKVNVNGIVKAFSGSASKMSVAGGNMINGLIKGMESRTSAVKTVVSSIISYMNNGIKSKMSLFRKAGSQIVVELSKGMTTQRSKITSSLRDTLDSAKTFIRGYHDNFYSAGSYLVTGFANGISKNDYKAEAKARAMAKAAKEAAEKALGIASPSKVFYKIGSFTGQGFVNALTDYGDKSYNAGSEIANSARKGLSRAISKVYDVVNSDMDVRPTIRPVMDLSEVTSGAEAISGLFNNDPSIGVASNLNSISSMMNRRNQNGGTIEVISAINALRKELGNVGGPSYTINGITYDDGSNITNAVRDLIRAAQIERRV